MDMTVIDTVQAHTLEVGDIIEWWDEGESLGLKALKTVNDSDVEGWIDLVSEEDDEMSVTFDHYAGIYGYTAVE